MTMLVDVTSFILYCVGIAISDRYMDYPAWLISVFLCFSIEGRVGWEWRYVEVVCIVTIFGEVEASVVV